MARSIRAYEFVRAAIRAREQQEAVLRLMQAVQRLGELATTEAAKTYEAAAASLDAGLHPLELLERRLPHFVVVDGRQYVVNRHGVTAVDVEVL